MYAMQQNKKRNIQTSYKINKEKTATPSKSICDNDDNDFGKMKVRFFLVFQPIKLVKR